MMIISSPFLPVSDVSLYDHSLWNTIPNQLNAIYEYDLEDFKYQLSKFLFSFPVRPPIRGYRDTLHRTKTLRCAHGARIFIAQGTRMVGVADGLVNIGLVDFEFNPKTLLSSYYKLNKKKWAS